MRKIFLLVLFAVLTQSILSNDAVESSRLLIDESEFLLMDEKPKEAIKKLSPVLQKNFDHKSYFLLAKIHQSMDYFSKSLKIYYYIVKTNYKTDLIELARKGNAEELFSKHPKPGPLVLETYFKIVATYMRMYELKRLYTPSQRKRFLEHAKGVIKILNYYDYKKVKNIIFLARIYGEQGYHQMAIEQLYFLRKIDPEMKDSPEIDYQVGDELVKLGEREMAVVFFRQSVSSPTAMKKLRENSDKYVDKINDNNLFGKVSIARGYRSDINGFSDTQRSNFDSSDRELYSVKGGHYLSKMVGVNYQAGVTKYTSSQFHLEFDDQSYYSSETSVYDQRDAKVGTSLIHSSHSKKLITAQLYYKKRWRKKGAAKSLSSYSDAFQILFKHSYPYQSGILSLEASYTPILYYNNQKGTKLRGAISFLPYGVSKKWRPGFSFDISSEDNVSWPLNNSRSLTMGPAITGQWKISDYLSFFQYCSYKRNASQSDELSYNEFAANLQLLYLLKFWKELGVHVNINGFHRKFQSSDTAINIGSTIGIAYYF